jgi:hypothetical protein
MECLSRGLLAAAASAVEEAPGMLKLSCFPNGTFATPLKPEFPQLVNNDATSASRGKVSVRIIMRLENKKSLRRRFCINACLL